MAKRGKGGGRWWQKGRGLQDEGEGLLLTGRHDGHGAYVQQLLAGRERFLVTLMREILRPGMVAVDGGAFIGYLTMQAARLVGSPGHVFAFEPNPQTLPYLRRNV